MLVKNEQSSKYGKDAYNSPWTIQEVQDNRTVKISIGQFSDIYNIWNITPYVSQLWIMEKCAINGVVINYKSAKLAYID